MAFKRDFVFHCFEVIFWGLILDFKRAHRLGVSPRSVYSNCAWGAPGDLTLESPENSGLQTSDVPNIPNIRISSTVPTASDFVDDTQPDGLKRFESTGQLRGGFVEATGSILQIEGGDKVPLGMLETAYIIRHRNSILSDSAIGLERPTASTTETEFAAFKRLLTEANTTPGNGYQYYFPAASAAYTYEPSVKAGERLAEQFKAHKWFLPTPGDAQRLRYLANLSESKFASAKDKAVLLLSGYAHTTGEHSSPYACYKCNMASGGIYDASYDNWSKKASNASVFPMVQF